METEERVVYLPLHLHLETFLGGMETRKIGDIVVSLKSLETFLGGMETPQGGKEDG